MRLKCERQNSGTDQKWGKGREAPVIQAWNVKDHICVNKRSQQELKPKGKGKIRFHTGESTAASETVQRCENDLWKKSRSKGHKGWSNSGQPVPTVWLRGDEQGRPTIISAERFTLVHLSWLVKVQAQKLAW